MKRVKGLLGSLLAIVMVPSAVLADGIEEPIPSYYEEPGSAPT